MLLRFEDYRALTAGKTRLLDALDMPCGDDIDFDPPKLNLGARPADLA